MPTVIDKVVYTAHARTTGGRDGRSTSDDMHLDVKLAVPTAMGGNGKGTNPEQLFAAGYSACFMSALRHVGSQRQLALPQDASIEASVAIGTVSTGFGLGVTMRIHLPGIAQDVARELVDAAHQICPYSNATRGNILVDLQLA